MKLLWNSDRGAWWKSETGFVSIDAFVALSILSLLATLVSGAVIVHVHTQELRKMSFQESEEEYEDRILGIPECIVCATQSPEPSADSW